MSFRQHNRQKFNDGKMICELQQRLIMDDDFGPEFFSRDTCLLSKYAGYKIQH